MFIIGDDPNGLANGDISIRTDKGTLVALVYANRPPEENRRIAEVIAAALNAACSPGHTDMMVTPESLDAWLLENPLDG